MADHKTLFRVLDESLFAAIANHPLVTDLVKAKHIQLWDKTANLQADFERASQKKNRLWIVPDGCDPDLHDSNGQIAVARQYEIGFGTGSAELVSMTAIESVVFLAVCQYCDGKNPDGTPLIDPTPWVLQMVSAGRTSPHFQNRSRIPEWRNIFGVTVHATASQATLAAMATVTP